MRTRRDIARHSRGGDSKQAHENPSFGRVAKTSCSLQSVAGGRLATKFHVTCPWSDAMSSSACASSVNCPAPAEHDKAPFDSYQCMLKRWLGTAQSRQLGTIACCAIASYVTHNAPRYRHARQASLTHDLGTHRPFTIALSRTAACPPHHGYRLQQCGAL